jgi:hypothetical protein
LRSLVHATFLSLSSDPWKAGGSAALYRNALLLDQFRKSTNAKLGFVWDFTPDTVLDFGRGTPGLQQPLWQHHYLLVELHKAANAKLLTGAQQDTLSAVADWAASQPVRYINEAVAGEWRVIPYETTVGRADYGVANGTDQGSGVYSGAVIDSLPTWGQQFAWYFVDPPPAVAGPWMTGEGFTNTYASMQADGVAGAYYPSYFWSALVAAVERSVPGADTAWTKVLGNVTNLSAWRGGFAADPRWGTFPRNTPSDGPPAPPGVWTVPAIDLGQGASSTFDLTSTLPSGTTRGGVFSVDPSGSPLPAGISLSSNGILSTSSQATASVSGVIFSYAL